MDGWMTEDLKSRTDDYIFLLCLSYLITLEGTLCECAFFFFLFGYIQLIYMH